MLLQLLHWPQKIKAERVGKQLLCQRLISKSKQSVYHIFISTAAAFGMAMLSHFIWHLGQGFLAREQGLRVLCHWSTGPLP